jgi:hypothetical protein
MANGKIDAASIKAATGQFDLESVFKLTMSHMGIRTIEALSSCPNLTELDLSSNHISRISGLESLKQLKKLILADNEIARIEGLDGLTSLETVHLQGNKLANLDDAQRLAKLPCLRTLRLHNNPICDHPAYWSAMRRMVPDVRSLDGQFSALADASGGDGDVLAELNLPEPEPWLKGFKWDDAASGELAGSEEFQKVVTDCKRLSARAQSMLAEVKTPR